MWYNVKKRLFSYINNDSISKSLVIPAIWLALMGAMNIIR